jgi:hypothetical protein
LAAWEDLDSAEKEAFGDQTQYEKYINDSISEFIDELQYQCLKNINVPLIEQFFNDLIDYFEKLDKKLENDGYDYLYNVDDDEIIEFCEINDYYFTKEGTFIA